MNFLSFNVRGIGGDGKAGFMRNLVDKHGVGFLAIQETHLSSFGMFDLHSVWGRDVFDFDIVDAAGRSGGLINVWNPKVFKKTSSLSNRNFLLTSGYMVADGSVLNCVNIYAPQKLGDKRALLNSLAGFISGLEGLVIIMGDFNAVRFLEERKNSRFNHRCAANLNKFVDRLGLFEYSMRGAKYTCLTVKDGNFKFSKIDRFFVCQSFLKRWPAAVLRALPRGGSDHSPLLLSLVDVNFGAKPFRWFNSWLDRDGCKEEVIKVLEDASFAGSPDVIINSKFKALKTKLKEWWSAFTSKEGEELFLLQADLERLEKVLEHRDLEEEELWVWDECKKGVDFINQCKIKDLKQKSRVRWALQGDDNTSFFHGMVNGRKAKNAIPGLLIDGCWISKPSLVKREVFKHFKQLFSEKTRDRPTLPCTGIKRLSAECSEALVAAFSKEEIHDAVFECGSDRAPGPDGFNFSFIKAFWSLLETDFIKLMDYFFDSGKIDKSCSAAYITLIPKSKNPVGLYDYRPITLIGTISKVVSKVLANRIKKVLNSVIADTQSAFLRDRFILDGPLMLNEVYGWLHKRKKKNIYAKDRLRKSL